VHSCCQQWSVTREEISKYANFFNSSPYLPRVAQFFCQYLLLQLKVAQHLLLQLKVLVPLAVRDCVTMAPNVFVNAENDSDEPADDTHDTEDIQETELRPCDSRAAGKIEGPTCQGHPDIFRVRWTIPGVMRDGIAKVNSPSFMIGNTTWSVILQLKEETANSVAGLGVFLDGSQDSNVMDPDEGGVDACFELAAENKDPQMTRARALHHRFCRESADWGFRELVSAEQDHPTFSSHCEGCADSIFSLFCSYFPFLFVMS
jgi:hypothetical protein